MDTLVLIKYGELTTKKGNRKQFINILHSFLLDKLKDIEFNIIKEYSRMYIEFNYKDIDKVKDVLSNTFGIHAYNVAYKVLSNEDNIKEKVIELLKDMDFKTFKVETNRRDKSFPINSLDFNKLMGGHILREITDINVDVHKPEIIVNIEIDVKNSYIYFNNIMGLGGYPVGVQGKSLLMLSGGIDSPVAGYLALKRGIVVDCVYFEALPHTSLSAREKVINLAKELLKFSPSFNLYVVSVTKIQELIYKDVNIDNDYLITILRRMMYRIAEGIANNHDHICLISGESIGQVASQTLTSLRAIENAINVPVIRPLACFDKLEIIELAKKINTYEISILPYEDCCTIFVPKHPVINPKIDKCLLYEEFIDYDALVKEAIDTAIVIKVEDKKEFDDLI